MGWEGSERECQDGEYMLTCMMSHVCAHMADSCECMAKTTTILWKKKKKRADIIDEGKKNNNISAMQETHLHGSSRVGKIPWRKKWQPTPVSLPEQSRIWTEESGGLHAWVCKRVGHDNE